MKLKERTKQILSDHLLKLEGLGRRVFTVKQLTELVNESRQRIGYWLKEKGFTKLKRKRVGKSKTAEYLVTSRSLVNLRKPIKMGFVCEHCGGTFYYNLQHDEFYKPPSHIHRKDNPKEFKTALCPNCDQLNHWATYSLKLTQDTERMKHLKKQIVFTAKPVKCEDPSKRYIVEKMKLGNEKENEPPRTVRALVDEMDDGMDSNNNFRNPY